jgi:hypothetical protein
MIPRNETETRVKQKLQPLPMDPDDVCNWDFDIGERPPPRRNGQIRVRLRKVPSEPPVVLDPDEE